MNKATQINESHNDCKETLLALCEEFQIDVDHDEEQELTIFTFLDGSRLTFSAYQEITVH